MIPRITSILIFLVCAVSLGHAQTSQNKILMATLLLILIFPVFLTQQVKRMLLICH
jgi:hypothetical protein